MAKMRYVWDQYKANKNALANGRSVVSAATYSAKFRISTVPPTAEMQITGVSPNMPFYRGSGSDHTSTGVTVAYSVSTYGRYLYTTDYGHSILCIVPDNVDSSTVEWAVGASVYLRNKASGSTISFNVYEPQVTKGDYVGLYNSEKQSAQPSGYDGSYYWYVYKGSEDIAPTGIVLDPSKIVPGQTATGYVVAPSTKYGGIWYGISCSIDGGSYQGIGGNGEKTFSVAVPDGTESMRLRAFASTVDGELIMTDFVYSITYYANEAPYSPPFVSIPDAVHPDEEFAVTWGAATDPDGNLSGYEIQRSYNGSSWSSVATASSTSITTTVERGKETVQYRVRAYDSKGEYSGWAYSNTAAVRNLRAFVGVNGKARRADKLYVGVNGKARQVVRGYIGVNGKARRFL